MSEYQCYEFQAIDRPLTEKEMGDLRDIAARKDGADFQQRLEALRTAHERKPTLIDRLHKVGLLVGDIRT